MFNYLISMIRVLTNRLLGSQVLTTIIISLIEDFREEGDKMVSVALANIKSVSIREDLDNSHKFNMVFDAAKEQFPDAATSLLNTTIEAAFRAFTLNKV